MITKNLYLETYQKQDEILQILSTEITCGRPSKYFRKIFYYLKHNGYMIINHDVPMYQQLPEIFNFIDNHCDAGTIHDLYYDLIN